MKYIIKKTNENDFANLNWNDAEPALINNFRPEGSEHRPETTLRLQYNNEGIFGKFDVKDKFIICVNTENQQPVYQDSCVEFFISPNKVNGYFNFEFNCIGKILSRFKTFNENSISKEILTENDLSKILLETTFKEKITEEITEPTDWSLSFFIPFKLLGKYAKEFSTAKGTVWKGNFFKCADKSSHPHWVSWSPVKELNFHEPDCFGEIIFG